jgi:hypothetical protein
MVFHRGRPRSEANLVNVLVHLRLREGQDDDLIRFFQQCPPKKRALFLKIALRARSIALTSIPEELYDRDELGDSLNNLIL